MAQAHYGPRRSVTAFGEELADRLLPDLRRRAAASAETWDDDTRQAPELDGDRSGYWTRTPSGRAWSDASEAERRPAKLPQPHRVDVTSIPIHGSKAAGVLDPYALNDDPAAAAVLAHIGGLQQQHRPVQVRPPVAAADPVKHFETRHHRRTHTDLWVIVASE